MSATQGFGIEYRRASEIPNLDFLINTDMYVNQTIFFFLKQYIIITNSLIL